MLPLLLLLLLLPPANATNASSSSFFPLPCLHLALSLLLRWHSTYLLLHRRAHPHVIHARRDSLAYGRAAMHPSARRAAARRAAGRAAGACRPQSIKHQQGPKNTTDYRRPAATSAGQRRRQPGGGVGRRRLGSRGVMRCTAARKHARAWPIRAKNERKKLEDAALRHASPRSIDGLPLFRVRCFIGPTRSR